MKRRSTSKGSAKVESPASSRGARIQKVLAEAGVGSRRHCETLVTEGHVRINGRLVKDLPAFVDPLADRIEVDGRTIGKPPRHGGQKLYIALHKPKQVISTTRDPQGRRCVTDLIEPVARRARLYPVGRLDAQSTGLILLTNDGLLANGLTHPRYEVAKRYEVTVRGRLLEEDLQRLRKGLFLASPARSQLAEPKRTAVESVRLLGHQADRTRGNLTQLLVTLTEGQNREIRRLLARLGYKVRRLHRTAIGPLTIKGLAAGQWRMLRAAEVHRLKKTAGMGATAKVAKKHAVKKHR